MGPKKLPTGGRRKAGAQPSSATDIAGSRVTKRHRVSNHNAARQASFRRHEPVDASKHPANSFVTLVIPTAKLGALNLPQAPKLTIPTQQINQTIHITRNTTIRQEIFSSPHHLPGSSGVLQLPPGSGAGSSVQDDHGISLRPVAANPSLNESSMQDQSNKLSTSAFQSVSSVPAAQQGILGRSLNISPSLHTAENSDIAAKPIKQARSRSPISRVRAQLPAPSALNSVQSASQTVVGDTEAGNKILASGQAFQSLRSLPKNPSRVFTVPESNSLQTVMAPVRDPNSVPGSIKDVIQNLFEVQTQVHGFVPETQPLLIEKMTELAQSLAHLQTITSPTVSPNNPIQQTRIAPEIIDYVDDGRNPDIFTRDFVELVQRGNAVINGKQQAFRDFSEVFAKALKEGMPDIEPDVDRVMRNVQNETKEEIAPNRENGAPRS